MTKGISRNSLLVLTLLFLHIPVHGRVSIGRLAGRVTDHSGAVGGGAAADIVNVLTGVGNQAATRSREILSSPYFGGAPVPQ